jgi:hypothetical protein
MLGHDLRSVARALGGAVSGRQVVAPGPGHSRHDRSLCIKLEDGAPEGFIVHSFAGDDAIACRDHVRERLGLPSWRPERASANGSGRRAAFRRLSRAVDYVYQDEHGAPYLRVTRTEPKAFRQAHFLEGKWRVGAPKGPKIPYRLPEILAAVHDTVFIVEGEKDADALAAAGFVVTTASGGAGKWTEDLNRWFVGKTVYILPDNDKPGADHAEKVAHNLAAVARDVRIVKLPGLAPKGDVSDWLAAGGDPNGLIDHCKAQPRYEPAADRPRGITAAELQGKVFPPVDWIVEGYIAEGLTVLAGKPKIGKSWLALDIALGVAQSGLALGGRQCVRGAVLYAALEDTPRRLQDRLRRLLGPLSRDPWPRELTLWSHGEMDRIDGAGIDQLRAWIAANPSARLIIIDTFAKVRAGQLGNETTYAADYREVGALKAIHEETGVSVILVAHQRKMAADDAFDTVSGTLGITGAADGTVILARDGLGTILKATGRDVAEIETAVELDKVDFRWRELGDAAEVRRSDERSQLLEALTEAGEAMTPAELVSATGQKGVNVRRLLAKMVRAGEVVKAKRGRYLHPDLDPGNNGHSGHNVTL